MLVTVFGSDFRSCAARMLKLRRVGIAVDFKCPDGRRGHIQFPTVDTVNND